MFFRAATLLLLAMAGPALAIEEGVMIQCPSTDTCTHESGIAGVLICRTHEVEGVVTQDTLCISHYEAEDADICGCCNNDCSDVIPADDSSDEDDSDSEDSNSEDSDSDSDSDSSSSSDSSDSEDWWEFWKW